MKDVTLRATDVPVNMMQRFEVVVDGQVAGVIELARRSTMGIEGNWRGPLAGPPREATKWEASPIGKDDWWDFRSRKAAIEHAIGGPVGKVTVAK
jgi:hypothetical protein